MADEKTEGTVITITVEDEDYPLDVSEFTARECGQLKSIGHIRGVLEIGDALQAGDLETVAALAVIAMQRAGKAVNPASILNMDFGKVLVHIPDDDSDPTEAAKKRQAAKPKKPEKAGNQS